MWQRLERKISFLCLFVNFFFAIRISRFFHVTFFIIHIFFPSALLYPHFPIRIRHPKLSGPRFTDTRWKLDTFTLFTHSLVGRKLENLRKQAVSIFFDKADILTENRIFGKDLYCKTRTASDYAYKLRVQDFATGKNFSFNQCPKQRVLLFSRESCFIKAIENFFPVFA